MRRSNERDFSSQPAFYECLTPEEKRAFDSLRTSLSSPDHRYHRNKRLDTFRDMLDEIREFCERSDGRCSIRSLVCGICWINNDLAINTRQLRLLLGKSKSSINGILSKLGFEAVSTKGSEQTILMEKIPILRGNFNESRQWTLRKYYGNVIGSKSELPKSISAPVLSANFFEIKEPKITPKSSLSLLTDLFETRMDVDYLDDDINFAPSLFIQEE